MITESRRQATPFGVIAELELFEKGTVLDETFGGHLIRRFLMACKVFDPKLLSPAIILFGLLAPPTGRAKDVGASIAVPENSKIQVVNEGHFTVRVSGGQLTGAFGCMCAGGTGTCEVASIVYGSNHLMACHKGDTGTCKGACSFTETGETMGMAPK